MSGQGYNKAVVVLGAGRCGTSLLMRILNTLGMRVSDRLVPPKAHNIDGPMEDIEIARVYDEVILKRIGSTRTMPFPDAILHEDVYKFCGKTLVDIVTRNAADSSQVWGFKDPYTSCLLPLWHRVFNVSNVVPVFILAVRNPASSVASRKKHFGVNASLGELAWLVNYVDASIYTALDLFIVHYEDWFSRPLEQASELADYVGLNSDISMKSSAVDIIKPIQDHSIFDEYNIQNEYVKNLYSVLRASKGREFDRKELMSVVKDCRAAMFGFQGWYFEAHKYISLSQKKDMEFANQVKKEIDQFASINESVVSDLKADYALLLENSSRIANALEANIASLIQQNNSSVSMLEADLAALVDQNNHLIQEVMSLKNDKIAFSMQIVNLKTKKDDVSFKHLLSLALKNIQFKFLFFSKMFNLSRLKSFFNKYKKFVDINSVYKIKKLRNKFILRDPDPHLIRVKFKDALRHPGKNTVLFPLKFIKYLLEIASHKFRTK